ncbi:MAG: folate-binding protein YgfZ [Saprospiraceae bacterium]|jgi:folate-binding protein YgfZ
MASSDWQNFLTQQGYSVDDNDQLVSENMPQKGQACVYDLSQLGSLVCAGEDAQNFLQGQLSNDISDLATVGDMQLSAYCTPKGRMLALFTVIKRDEESFFLFAPQAVITKVKSRLQMFVMRAKVTLSDNEDTVIFGYQENTATSDDMGKLFDSQLTAAIPNTQNRYLVVLPTDKAIDICSSLPEPCTLVDHRHWQTLDISDGIPQLNIELVDELIPQSINLDLVGGVNFKKGCYPGQEIIARIKYRGKPKTRMLSAEIASHAAPAIGSPVFIDGRAQSAGVVISLGTKNSETTAILITCPVSTLHEGNHYLGAPDGEKIERTIQAYSITT